LLIGINRSTDYAERCFGENPRLELEFSLLRRSREPTGSYPPARGWRPVCCSFAHPQYSKELPIEHPQSKIVNRLPRLALIAEGFTDAAVAERTAEAVRAGANRFGRSLGDGGVGEALRDERQAGQAIDDFRLRMFDWQFFRVLRMREGAADRPPAPSRGI